MRRLIPALVLVALLHWNLERLCIGPKKGIQFCVGAEGAGWESHISRGGRRPSDIPPSTIPPTYRDYRGRKPL